MGVLALFDGLGYRYLCGLFKETLGGGRRSGREHLEGRKKEVCGV